RALAHELGIVLVADETGLCRVPAVLARMRGAVVVEESTLGGHCGSDCSSVAAAGAGFVPRCGPTEPPVSAARGGRGPARPRPSSPPASARAAPPRPPPTRPRGSAGGAAVERPGRGRARPG